MSTYQRILPPLIAAALLTTGSSAQDTSRQASDAPRSEVNSVYAARLLQADTRTSDRQAQRAALETQTANIFSLASLQQLSRVQPRTPQPDAPVAVEIDWSAAQVDRRRQGIAQTQNATTATTAFVAQTVRPTNPQAAEAQNTRLPVLLPPLQVLQINGTPTVLLFPRENFYTASITGDRVVIEVFGTRLAHTRAPDARAARNFAAGSNDGYRIAQTEYGQEVHFNRYGAAYSVTIECDRPEQDTRCTSQAYARQLAEALVIVAGTPGEGG